MTQRFGRLLLGVFTLLSISCFATVGVFAATESNAEDAMDTANDLLVEANDLLDEADDE